MHRCWSCRTELPADARYCYRCGLSQDDRQTLPLYVVDASTGLFNSVFVQALVDHELTRAWRHKRPLAVVAIELDNVELVRDENDRRLERLTREVASLIKSVIRDTDTMGFLEGSGRPRFAVLLPETDWEGAVHAAGKIRDLVSDQTFDYLGNWQQLTLSCGVAAFDPESREKRNLLQLAVQALETGQETGPN